MFINYKYFKCKQFLFFKPYHQTKELTKANLTGPSITIYINIINAEKVIHIYTHIFLSCHLNEAIFLYKETVHMNTTIHRINNQ